MVTKKKVTPMTEVETDVETNVETLEEIKPQPKKSIVEIAKELEKKGKKLRKVTVFYNDTRDNHTATTAYANCTNAFFNLAKVVPLGVQVELEQCLCDNLEEATILIHVPANDGSGNVMPKRIKKYNLAYGD